MNPIKSTIGYADYSWNPVTGCTHGCKYCYAKKANDLHYKAKPESFLPDFSNPKLWKNRLDEPLKRKKPATIFVCDMGDLFCSAVQNAWIDEVIDITYRCQQHKFLFLTKNPFRYPYYEFPDNCMLGISYTGYGNENGMLCALLDNPNKKIISFEPVMGLFYGNGLQEYIDKIDMVVVGAMTKNGKNNVIPRPEWIQSVRDVVPEEKIFWKENIKKYL